MKFVFAHRITSMSRITVFVLYFKLLFITNIDCDDKPNFGKYFLTPTQLIRCNLTKLFDDQHALDFNINIIESGKKKGEISGYLYIPSDFKYERVTFSINFWRNGKFEQFLHRNTSSVCTDMLLSLPLRLIIKPDKNCIARTGNYTFSMNLNQFAHMLIGRNFFYQKIHSRIEYYSRVGSVFCLEAIAETRPI